VIVIKKQNNLRIETENSFLHHEKILNFCAEVGGGSWMERAKPHLIVKNMYNLLFQKKKFFVKKFLGRESFEKKIFEKLNIQE